MAKMEVIFEMAPFRLIGNTVGKPKLITYVDDENNDQATTDGYEIEFQ